MRTPSVWPGKVAALIRSGNSAGALAQIKVAPTLKDLASLQRLLTTTLPVAGQAVIDSAITDQINALSAPRLHRSP